MTVSAAAGLLQWAAPATLDGEPLEVRSAWPRDEGHVVAEMVTPRGAVVAAQWFADEARRDRVAARTPAPARVDPASGLLLHLGGADRKVPAVPALLAEPGAWLLRHRAEQRAVVVRPGGTFAKALRPERAAEVLRAHEYGVAAARGAFTVPRIAAHDLAAGVVETAPVPGRMLLDLGADPGVADATVRAAWARTGEIVGLLHGGPREGLPAHSPLDEVALVARRLHLAAAAGLLPRVDAASLLEPLTAEPPGPPGLLHRDLHDKQVLVDDDGSVALIDLDTLAAGERALDVANVLVHIDLRVLQGALSAERARRARDAFLAACGPDPDTLRRVPAYAVATRLRLAAVYAFRPAGQAAARGMLDSALRRTAG